jgi:hypothetical protein
MNKSKKKAEALSSPGLDEVSLLPAAAGGVAGFTAA